MFLKIQSAFIEPNPVLTNGNYIIRALVEEKEDDYIPWYGAGGMALTDENNNNLHVKNRESDQTSYYSKWYESELNEMISSWISLMN